MMLSARKALVNAMKHFAGGRVEHSNSFAIISSEPSRPPHCPADASRMRMCKARFRECVPDIRSADGHRAAVWLQGNCIAGAMKIHGYAPEIACHAKQ